MIEFSNVSFAYQTPSGAVPALRGVTLALRPGETVAVLGANGSGKSTLALLANGLRTPGEGSVVVDGMDTTEPDHVWDVRTRVGLVLQNPDNQIVSTTVEEDVAFGPENLGVEPALIRTRVGRVLDAVGLAGLERREPHRLSGGQRQRLAIAGVLALEPAYLVLDEPTAMLDLQGREDVLGVLETLRDRGTGIIHITHHLADAARADRVFVLDRGAVALQGSPTEVFSSPALADLGLAIPPIGVLAEALRSRDVPVPVQAYTAEAVAEAL